LFRGDLGMLPEVNAQKAVDLHHAARHLPSLPRPMLREG